MAAAPMKKPVETAPAATEAAPAAPPSPVTAVVPAKPQLTRRDALPKRFPPSCLKPLGYGETEIVTVTAPAGMTFAEATKPEAWATAAGTVAKDQLNTRNLRDGTGIIIMMDTADNTYHAWLRVKKVVRDKLKGPCGLEVMCIGPSVDLTTGEARPIDLATGKAWVDPPDPSE